MSTPMAAIDAQFYWMSAKIPNGFLLLYAFDGLPTNLERAIDEFVARARNCPALTIRVEDGSPLTYPRWVTTTVDTDRIVRHDEDTWDGCLREATKLVGEELDCRRMPWRMHLFGPVRSVPGTVGRSTVAVMQFAHALCDGPRALAMCAWLFGRNTPVADVSNESTGFLPWRALEATRAHRRRVKETNAGLLPSAIGPRPAVSTNVHPAGERFARTLIRHRAQLGDRTATVATLSAISGALSSHLCDEAESLAAEVTMAKPGVPHAHNHFANVTVGLYPGLSREARLEKIAADLRNARRRSEHVAVRAADRAFAATPAPLLRWGISLFDPEAQPSYVAGHTVVSSLHRGRADLTFGDAPVLLTAVHLALSPAMGLVHGVWGIGDTVTVTVHAAESAIPDIDEYMARLDSEL